MSFVDSGVSFDREVAKTRAPWEAYCSAREAPRPRVAPTMRTVGIVVAVLDVGVTYFVNVWLALVCDALGNGNGSGMDDEPPTLAVAFQCTFKLISQYKPSLFKSTTSSIGTVLKKRG